MTFRKAARGDEVMRELVPGQSRELLRTLGIVDARGNVQADARRKLKQVNHLVRLLAPALEDAFRRHAAPVLVDAGAGNAYLGFILYELFCGPLGHDRGEVLAVEARADLMARVRERARALGYARLRPVEARLDAAELPGRIHVLVALHACDTATDDALALAIRRGVDHVAVVPCCQAEVAELLRVQGEPGGGKRGTSAPRASEVEGEPGGGKRGTSAPRASEVEGDAAPDPALRPLWRHAWHRRELGSHLTNVVRALALEAHGYQVTVTELAGWEHAVKNELILARRVGRASRRARVELEALLARVGVRPALVRALDATASPALAEDDGDRPAEDPAPPAEGVPGAGDAPGREA